MGSEADARAGRGWMARLGLMGLLVILSAIAVCLPPTETQAIRSGGGAGDAAVTDGETRWRPLWETLGSGEPYAIRDGGETGPVRERGRIVRTVRWALLGVELLILAGCVGTVGILTVSSPGDRLRTA